MVDAPIAADADPWDDEHAPVRLPSSPELHLAGFDGPMELLLDLAERQRIDLGRISVLELAEQFVAALVRLERQVPLERRADWLVLATRLLLLRSRLLIATSPEAEEEAVRDAEREADRLDRLVVLRAAAAWLERRPRLGRDVYGRPVDRAGRVASYMALMEACLAVLRGANGQQGADVPVYQTPPPALFQLDEAMARIRTVLVGQARPVDFVRCLPPVGRTDPIYRLKARSAVSSSLLAVLELARCGELSATQAAPHAPILLKAGL